MALTNKELKLIAEIVSETVNKAMSENRRRESTYSEDIVSELKQLTRETRNYINKTQSNTDLKGIFTDFTENLKKQLEESNKKIDERQEDFLKLQDDYFKQKQKIEDDRNYIEGLKKEGSDPAVIKDLEQTLDQNQKALEKFLEKYDKKIDNLNEQIQKNIEENQKQLTEEMFTGLKKAGEGIFRKDLRETKNVDEATENYKKALLKQYAALEENSQTMLELGITDEKLDEIKQDLYSSYIEELERQRDKANLDSKTKKILEEKIKKEKIELGRSTYEETYGKTSAIGKLSGRLADFTTKRFKEENEKTSIAAKAFNSGLGALFKGKGAKQPYLETGKKTGAGILISDIEKENQKKNFKKSESFANNNQPVPPRPLSPQPVVPQPTTNQPVAPQPTTNQLVTPQPTTNQLVTPQPTTNQPVVPQPTTNQPVVPQPTPSQTSEPKVFTTLLTPQSNVPLPTPNITPQKIEETKKIEEPLAEKNAKIEATTSVNPTADSENINYLLQLVEEAKENAPFKVIISDIGSEGKKNLTDVFNDAINETLKPIITEDLAEILKENNKLSSLLKLLKRKGGKEEPKKEPKNEQGSGVPPIIRKKAAQKALEYGAKGYGYMTGGLGISGLLGSKVGTIAGGALTKAGAGAAITSAGLVAGTAIGGYGLGYGLEQYGGKDEDTGNRKGGAGTFLIERSVGQSKERKNEQIINEAQENQKFLNLRTDLTQEDKKIERFKIDLERLQKQKELSKSFGYNFSDSDISGKDNGAQIEKQIEKVKTNISKLENNKKRKQENKEQQIKEIEKRDPFLESGAFDAALKGTTEPYELKFPEKQNIKIAGDKTAEQEKKTSVDFSQMSIAKVSEEAMKGDTLARTEYESRIKNKYGKSYFNTLKYAKQAGIISEQQFYDFKNKSLNLNSITKGYVPIEINGKNVIKYLEKDDAETALAALNVAKTMGNPIDENVYKELTAKVEGKTVVPNIQSQKPIEEKESNINQAFNSVDSHTLGNMMSGGNNSWTKKLDEAIDEEYENTERKDLIPFLSTAAKNQPEAKEQLDKLIKKAGPMSEKDFEGMVQNYKLNKEQKETLKKTFGVKETSKQNTSSDLNKLKQELDEDTKEAEQELRKMLESSSEIKKKNQAFLATPDNNKGLPQIKLDTPNPMKDLEPLLATNNQQTQQTNELLQQLLKVMAGKDYNPTSITPVMVNPIVSNSTSTQTQSPAYEFRTQNRVMA